MQNEQDIILGTLVTGNNYAGAEDHEVAQLWATVDVKDFGGSVLRDFRIVRRGKSGIIASVDLPNGATLGDYLQTFETFAKLARDGYETTIAAVRSEGHRAGCRKFGEKLPRGQAAGHVCNG